MAEHEDDAGRLGELFLRVGKLLRVAEARRFAAHGLTPAQGRVLGVLADATRQLCMGDVAEILGVVPRAVTPQIDALEQARLVHRRTDPGNRRSTLLDLTAEGAAVRRRLLQERVQAVDEVFAELTSQQRHSLIDLLAAATPGGTSR